MKPATPWLVCYDIAEPGRLARVGRAAREFGVPLQYSVLWARLDGIGLGAAMSAIATRIDPRFDDVRFYPLPENVQITGLGREVVPLGVDLGDPVLRRFRQIGWALRAESATLCRLARRAGSSQDSTPNGRPIFDKCICNHLIGRMDLPGTVQHWP